LIAQQAMRSVNIKAAELGISIFKVVTTIFTLSG
jgi:hypothetical protein